MKQKLDTPMYYDAYEEPSFTERLLAHFKTKKPKEVTEVQAWGSWDKHWRATLGIGLLLAIVSIAFSTYVTITFVGGHGVYVALAPQVVFAVASLVRAFSKIYK
jgi:hypothetical protein